MHFADKKIKIRIVVCCVLMFKNHYDNISLSGFLTTSIYRYLPVSKDFIYKNIYYFILPSCTLTVKSKYLKMQVSLLTPSFEPVQDQNRPKPKSSSNHSTSAPITARIRSQCPDLIVCNHDSGGHTDAQTA